jgi:hypothetical protein
MINENNSCNQNIRSNQNNAIRTIKVITMKNMLIVATLFLFACTNYVGAREPLKNATCIYGYHNYVNESLHSIEANGTAIMEETEVAGLVQVNGFLKAEESTMHSLKVNGQTELHNCLITNSTTINGLLDAEKTQFQNGLSIASQKIILRGCTVDSLTIRKLKEYAGKQVVYLRSGTVVTGTIIFESGKGELWISLNSKVADSQVSGAQIYRR